MFHNNSKWCIIVKNCESLCCTPATYIIFKSTILELKNIKMAWGFFGSCSFH